MEKGKHECAEILLKLDLKNISFDIIEKILDDDNADYFKWIYDMRPELRQRLNHGSFTRKHDILAFIQSIDKYDFSNDYNIDDEYSDESYDMRRDYCEFI
jgi:hypothetical protein